MTERSGPIIPWEERQLPIPEYAALCREHCRQPAQGFPDDVRACGSVDGEGDERTFRFCGRHWGAVIGHD